MNIFKTGVLCTLIYANYCYACAETALSTADGMSNATDVYIGRIVSISIPELNDIDAKQAEHTARYSNKVLNFKIYDVIKGFESGNIDLHLDWCTGGVPKLGVLSVLYYIDGSWHVNHDLTAIELAKKSLKN